MLQCLLAGVERVTRGARDGEFSRPGSAGAHLLLLPRGVGEQRDNCHALAAGRHATDARAARPLPAPVALG
jgi:hypothetical protein